jgi:hypothetical protein
VPRVVVIWVSIREHLFLRRRQLTISRKFGLRSYGNDLTQIIGLTTNDLTQNTGLETSNDLTQIIGLSTNDLMQN